MMRYPQTGESVANVSAHRGEAGGEGRGEVVVF
jgi:hypothetical protein